MSSTQNELLTAHMNRISNSYIETMTDLITKSRTATEPQVKELLDSAIVVSRMHQNNMNNEAVVDICLRAFAVLLQKANNSATNVTYLKQKFPDLLSSIKCTFKNPHMAIAFVAMVSPANDKTAESYPRMQAAHVIKQTMEFLNTARVSDPAVGSILKSLTISLAGFPPLVDLVYSEEFHKTLTEKYLVTASIAVSKATLALLRVVFTIPAARPIAFRESACAAMIATFKTKNVLTGPHIKMADSILVGFRDTNAIMKIHEWDGFLASSLTKTKAIVRTKMIAELTTAAYEGTCDDVLVTRARSLGIDEVYITGTRLVNDEVGRKRKRTDDIPKTVDVAAEEDNPFAGVDALLLAAQSSGDLQEESKCDDRMCPIVGSAW
ncbi:MAG: hypothetical protein CBC65_000955 [Rhodothermaceae bacterium TMED105]|jgi:hypothetical protein|nr:MAG: hypothetical protein CBC65_000955 [Rhodothermaceae bacterium TMED105]|tara:strand:- start:96 stop:1235 length:1140 start_codon:yes stop_codon:yes gene_type:complete